MLAFHLALVNNPQNSLVVLAFAATLYHGEWNEGVNYAREKSLVEINLRPEITRSAKFKSEEKLAEGVTRFALKVQGCIAALTSKDCLLEAMSTFPASSNSGLVRKLLIHQPLINFCQIPVCVNEKVNYV